MLQVQVQPDTPKHEGISEHDSNTATPQHISTFWCTFLLLFRKEQTVHSLHMESESEFSHQKTENCCSTRGFIPVELRTSQGSLWSSEGPRSIPFNFGLLTAELCNWRLLLLSAKQRETGAPRALFKPPAKDWDYSCCSVMVYPQSAAKPHTATYWLPHQQDQGKNQKGKW